ncbi:MAG: precorrin-8X methylmutase [Firmicutes bacterium]|nr:precorrin-8X methylmutase [Bacillota bacterium]
MDIEYLKPDDIEKRSMEIIEMEMRTNPPKKNKEVIKRVIHATADFDYEHNILFSDGAVEEALKTLKEGAVIVTDTNMALAGINKKILTKHGCEAVCYMADPEIAEQAKLRGVTRAIVSMEKAAKLKRPTIFVIGNAPTALIRLNELIESKEVAPRLVIGIPVGFVNVVESKEMLIRAEVPYITSTGRKGGSTVAAAVCNALLYML